MEPKRDGTAPVGRPTESAASTRSQDPTLLLEQYKLYVEMADRVSSRRIEANKFYTSILSGILALVSIVSVPLTVQSVVLAAVAVLGIALCVVWLVNIRSYRELNSLKFAVIHEMEAHLPFACYDREWEILRNGKGRRVYVRLTRIEQYVPLLMMIPYLVLLASTFLP